MNLKWIALSLFFMIAPGVVSADEPAPPPQTQIERDAVQAWGRAHADCEEWSDSCVACTKAGCSTAGIACTPKETICRAK